MNKSLTVVIPAYNEQDNLNQAIDSVQRAMEGLVDDYEIIVVNDGSQDRTPLIAQERMQQDARIQCISNDRNRGYGDTFWRGVMASRKDYVSVFPGDNDMSWESFREQAQYLGQADIISGYMSSTSQREWHRRLLSSLFVVLMNAAFNMRLKYYNGPLLCRRELMQALTIRSRGLTILAECKVKLIKQGCSYVEIPFTHIHRCGGRSTALSLKSIKAVLVAMVFLYRDVYWKKTRS